MTGTSEGEGGVERLTDKLNLTSAGDVTVSAPVQWVEIPCNFILYLVPSMYSINIGCNPSSNASSLALHTTKKQVMSIQEISVIDVKPRVTGNYLWLCNARYIEFTFK